MPDAETITAQDIWSARVIQLINDQDGKPTAPDVAALAKMDPDAVADEDDPADEDAADDTEVEATADQSVEPEQASGDLEGPSDVQAVAELVESLRESAEKKLTEVYSNSAAKAAFVYRHQGSNLVVVLQLKGLSGESGRYTKSSAPSKWDSASKYSRSLKRSASRYEAGLVYSDLDDSSFLIDTFADWVKGPRSDLAGKLDWASLTLRQLRELPREMLEQALREKDAAEAEQLEKQGR